MAALNPARDLGPRVFGFLVGYGEVAIPGLRGEFWLPTVSTVIGGVLAGGLYDGLTRRYLAVADVEVLEEDVGDVVAADRD